MARKRKEEWKVYGNVFDAYTHRVLFKLESQGYFSRLVSAYKLGKEANVFLAETKDGGLVVVKIYRLESCNFNKMYEYLVQDERYADLKGQRRKIIFSWVQREYRNLLKAREVIRVPTPIALRDHVLVMELIGGDEPAPQLKDAPPRHPEEFFEKVITAMVKLQRAGLVHSDLSAFNILNHDEEPVFIDFSQATTTKSHGWESLLRRDLRNIITFFSKQGVSIDEEEVFARFGLRKEE